MSKMHQNGKFHKQNYFDEMKQFFLLTSYKIKMKNPRKRNKEKAMESEMRN
jgi:hypothetical protein